MNNFGNCSISTLEVIKNKCLLLHRITVIYKLLESLHSYKIDLELSPSASSNCAAEDWVIYLTTPPCVFSLVHMRSLYGQNLINLFYNSKSQAAALKQWSHHPNSTIKCGNCNQPCTCSNSFAAQPLCWSWNVTPLVKTSWLSEQATVTEASPGGLLALVGTVD